MDSPGRGSQKMKAFNIAPVSKKPGKPEVEIPRKSKTLEEEKAAAEVYEEFLASFDEPAKHGKLFVRGSIINAGSGEEKSTTQTGKLYKPQKIVDIPPKKPEERPETAKEKADKIKKKEKEKKKSNLELFKEELRMIQEEREERHRLKAVIKEQAKQTRVEPPEPANQIRLADDYRIPGYGSHDTGDPGTTNLYLGNLNPKMTEQQLCEVFGQFGPLASVKIMWPRSEEERARGRNCGFVAFMNRRDGERSMKNLNGKDVMGFEMKLGWGKAVPIPPHPIYIPPAMMELTLPPPPSGLPFNAQLERQDNRWIDEPETKAEFYKLLESAVVKVVIPTERTLLSLIHRMIEFVVREGPMFEAMIMNREINNPMFRFLFDNQTPAHVYYRWRLYSILKGDHATKWQMDEFYMFRGGSVWKPPPMNPFLHGMPQEMAMPAPKPIEPQKGSLSDTQRDKLEELLRNINPEKFKVADAMIYCIEHSEAADEVIECIHESIAAPDAPLFKKIARLYVISDVLHNCSVKIGNASLYRKGFQEKLPDIFTDLHECYKGIDGRMKAEQFKQRIVNCFRAWEDWAVYPSEFLIKLQNVFLGLVPCGAKGEEGDDSPNDATQASQQEPFSDDIDGVPLGGEDIDGIPMDGAPPEETADIDGVPLSEDVDIDGQPMDDAQSDGSATQTSFPTPKFKPSKWEMVDPEIVEAQAITTSKWDLLEQAEEEQQDEEAEDLDGKPMDENIFPDIDGTQLEEDTGKDSPYLVENVKSDVSSDERRAKLREIELKVMKYQDELESGKRSRKPHMRFSEQVEHYRQKLLKKVDKSDREPSDRDRHKRDRHKSSSPHVSQIITHVSPSSEEQEEEEDIESPSSFIVMKKPSPRSVALTISESGSSTHSPHRCKRHHSRSPKKSRRSRSRSPKRSRRSRSKSPHKRYSSPSLSPQFRKHKSKRSKY